MNPNRNPHLQKDEIEVHLRDYLNVEKIIWLERGVYGDETSGHVDNLCCFIRPGVLALAWTEDPADPQFEIPSDAYYGLQSAADARGRPFEIIKIHQPEPLYIAEEESRGVDSVEGTYPRRAGDRMAASYGNFYIANRGVIVPVFGASRDAQALEALVRAFPERQVVGVPAREILLGGGNIHCITQQQPLG